MSNYQNYVLMHKNIPTAILTIDRDTGNIYKSEVLDEKHAPVCYTDKKSFNNWWERRAIPKHQQNQEILLNGKTNLEYMTENLGLSMIDNYWIKPIDVDLSWEDVNLYCHNFCEKDFSFQDLENASPFKPSATTQGELQKRWVIKDGDRFLIKGNYGTLYRQSINEVFATRLHELQNVAHTSYDLVQLPTTLGTGIGCISKNFTTENLEFIPAYDITFMGNKPNDISIYKHYINTCIEHGIDTKVMQDFMDYQIMSDFLLTNTDRHLLNLGVLRDPVSLQFICPAPIFDTGNAMFFNADYNEATVFDIPVTSWYKTELKLINQVKNFDILDLDQIPGEEIIDELYGQDKYSVVYLDNLKRGYLKKIEMIEALQKGYSLNKRNNNFYLNQPFVCEHDSLSSDDFIKDE